MLTVRYEWLGLRAGDRLLDLGCGAGRHAFEAYRRGARVVAFDYDMAELKDVAGMFGALTESEASTLPASAWASATNGDATRLPFPDATFDRVIAAEVLEHIPDDEAAISELARVLRPGGTMAITVPAWLAEQVCWALNDEYHAPFVPGGHVRIYSEPELRSKLRAAGLKPGAAHHAHALHTPYWWLKCAVGPTNNDHPLVRAYHEVLLWDIAGRQPMARFTKLADRLANPLLGKSIVVYARKAE
ncbi:MAG TPA: class I SAM-dependent methyltransferase [Acidimicrobiales bacterium]|nr:class I SAM-dependent methyltransferase [Acidimicrobiales bacterium]